MNIAWTTGVVRNRRRRAPRCARSMLQRHDPHGGMLGPVQRRGRRFAGRRRSHTGRRMPRSLEGSGDRATRETTGVLNAPAMINAFFLKSGG